jgi:hypothetical protein
VCAITKYRYCWLSQILLQLCYRNLQSSYWSSVLNSARLSFESVASPELFPQKQTGQLLGLRDAQ